VNVDFHCHTTASDGLLPPAEVVARAVRAGVELLAITDHDTLAAFDTVSAGRHADLTLVPGVEFSTTWHDTGIHVVGLNTAPESAAMREAVAAQGAAREARAERIGQRLVALGLPDLLPAARAEAGDAVVGRPHFARALVAAGLVTSEAQAFRRYLGAGRPGDVRDSWAPLERVVGWIRDAGGVAVLAHPGHYRLSRTRRQRLIAAFKAAGGEAVEVISGHQDVSLTAQLARDVTAHGLEASVGSDFHGPGPGVMELGGAGPLPRGCTPVWERFAP